MSDCAQAYLDLFAADRTQADILMGAMKNWVASHRDGNGGVDAATVSSFEQWVGERKGSPNRRG
jgi:hypothetical protein